MDAIQDRVNQVQIESVQLIQYLHNLPQEAWGQQSACDGWTIADVAAHLIGGANFYTSIILRGFEGYTTPPDGFPYPFDAPQEEMSAVNAKVAVSLRNDLGDGLLAEFRSTNEKMNQTLAEISGNGWETPCYHSIGVVPARIVLSLRMFELALHGWDIRSSLQPDARPAPQSLTMSLEILTAISEHYVQPAASLAASGRYRFHLTGAGLGDYEIVAGNGPARLEPAGTEPADFVFQCSAEDFVLLMTHRLPLESAMSDRRLIIEGGRELPSGFGNWFQGAW